MPTLHKSQVQSILEHLDAAAAALPPSSIPGIESSAAWHLRCARRRLYNVALTEIAVEPVILAEAA